MNLKFIFPLLLLLFLSFNSPIFACTPGGPDPWFDTELDFNEVDFPRGVSVSETRIRNTSSVPLYMVRSNTLRNVYEGSELPEEYIPEYKLVSGDVYYWGWRSSSKEQERWVLREKGDLEIDSGDYDIDGKSAQVYEDGRSKDVAIPDPQEFSIATYYNGSPLNLTGTINYSLNKDYDPKKFQKGADGCAAWNDNQPSMLYLIGWVLVTRVLPVVAIISVLVLLIYKLIKRIR